MIKLLRFMQPYRTTLVLVLVLAFAQSFAYLYLPTLMADIVDNGVVRHAADVAQASEFISEMREGFHSEIAQGGTNVSGGQKQRLSIARALVRKPEIYVFDDTFSALDFKTDARLRAALKKETCDATVLIVAQRGGSRVTILYMR